MLPPVDSSTEAVAQHSRQVEDTAGTADRALSPEHAAAAARCPRARAAAAMKSFKSFFGKSGGTGPDGKHGEAGSHTANAHGEGASEG